jgi:hypothetical protein
VDTGDLDAGPERTDGVTASFLEELLRRAALLDTRNAMTRTLLGSGRAWDAEPGRG